MPQTPATPDPKKAGSKVPRPPNAFIIYRQEWHPKVVAQNPGLHNNAISVIIGKKWRAESEDVRDRYKRKAEDAKRQHELDHPGYQYQPR
ncbi:mating-type protein MAT1-2, partial [Teratosphaeria nubilosa]